MRDVSVRIEFDDDVTDREAEEHTRALMRRLERLNIDRVDLVEGAAAPGTRADVTTVAGVLALVGLSIRTVLPHVVAVVQSWLETSAQKSVTLEIGEVRMQMNGRVRVTDEEVQRMITLLEQREAGSATPIEPADPVDPAEGGGA